MATSTVYPAKSALKELLENAAWPVEAPMVRWGQPTESEDFPRPGSQGVQLLYFLPTTIEDELITLGATRNDERYSIRLMIEVRRYGDDEQTTEQRGWNLYNVVLDTVRADHTLAGTVNRVNGYRKSDESIPTDQGWLFRLLVEIDVVGLVF